MKKDSGITIITLAITVIVMLILVSVGIVQGTGYIKEVRINRINTELYEVQNAVFSQYTLFTATNNNSYLKGNVITKSSVEALLPAGMYLSGVSGSYYELNPNELESIGIKKAKDTYIVNYETGEVINKTKKTNEDGVFLYIRGR